MKRLSRSPRLRAAAPHLCASLAALALLGLGLFYGGIAAFEAGYFGEIPSEAELRYINTNEASVVLSRDGR